jgi:hypothetical protein
MVSLTDEAEQYIDESVSPPGEDDPPGDEAEGGDARLTSIARGSTEDNTGGETEYEQDPSDGSLSRGTIAGGLGNVDDTDEEREQATDETETTIRTTSTEPATEVRENTSPEAVGEAVNEALENAEESFLPWWVKFIPVLLGLLVFLYLIRPLLTVGANLSG